MKRSRSAVLTNTELLAMLIREPELLAFADALVVTGVTDEFRSTADRRLPAKLGAAAGVAAAVVVAIALVFAPSWSGGPTAVEEALAAVGSASVLHVEIAATEPINGALLDINTGRPIPLNMTTEIWFDPARDVKRTVEKINGQVVDERVETTAGGFTSTGRVFTCSWIQNHPVQAARAGVACPEPSAAGDESPALDAALADFLDGYRAALATGAATEVGEDKLDGRSVVWLQFDDAGSFERVAIDAATHRPVQVEATGGSSAFRVIAAQSINYNRSLFKMPDPRPAKRIGGAQAERRIDPAQASLVLGRDAYWLGRRWNGFELVSVVEQERRVESGERSNQVDRLSTVKLTYAPTETSNARGAIDVYLAPQCVVSLGWTCSPRDPADQESVGYPVGPDGPALAYRDGLYISVWGFTGSQEASLALFRSLVSVEESD
jgi:hypothetical protein